jgi:hypothetical protein
MENSKKMTIKNIEAALKKSYVDGYISGLNAIPKHLAPLTDEEIQAALGIDASSSNWNLIKVLEWGNKIQAALLEKNK